MNTYMKSCRTCIYGPVPIPGERCQYRCAPHNWAEYVADGSVSDIDQPAARLPGCAEYVDDHAGLRDAMQDAAEERIDIIGQNGNDGLGYESPKNPKEIRIIPTKVIAVDVVDETLFVMEAFDEFTVTVDIKTLLGKGNIKEVTAALAAALDVMALES